VCTVRITRRRAALDSLDQARDVVRVEPDGASEPYGAQLAALDEPLHGSWVDVEKLGRLVRRQERCVVCGGFGGDVALSSCAATPRSCAFGRLVGPSPSLSPCPLRSFDRLGLRRAVGLEEGELTYVEPHATRVTYQ
jgi:hypothetical protein